MILKQKHNLDPELKKQLNEYVYDIIGYMIDVSRESPCGLLEYIYQEAFSKVLEQKGVEYNKEYVHHPTFRGEELKAFMKMDFMIPRTRGNVIIECKALENITTHERQQLFSYLIASGFPIGILVNFANYPHPHIEKYYFDKRDMTITAF